MYQVLSPLQKYPVDEAGNRCNLYEYYVLQLQRVYNIRGKAIKTCVDETAANVSRLSAARDAASSADRDETVRQLRKEQTKVYC